MKIIFISINIIFLFFLISNKTVFAIDNSPTTENYIYSSTNAGFGHASYPGSKGEGIRYKPIISDTFDRVDMWICKNNGSPSDSLYLTIVVNRVVMSISEYINSDNILPCNTITSLEDLNQYKITFKFGKVISLDSYKSSEQNFNDLIVFRTGPYSDTDTYKIIYLQKIDAPDGDISTVNNAFVSGLGDAYSNSSDGNSHNDAFFKTWNSQSTECCSNVAFFPGIEASRLYSTSNDGSENRRWEPFTNSEVPKLFLNEQGVSNDSSVYTKDIIDHFEVVSGYGPDIYSSFKNEMNSLVLSGVVNDWKPFPYDWRLDVADIVGNGITYKDHISKIESDIETLATTSKTGKVTIISHSNGGLVAKALMLKLREEGKENLIDKVIFVGVPQLGTPDSVEAMLHGMTLGGGLILKRDTARTFAENMPGAYGLLPSQKYFEDITDYPVISFDDSVNEMSNFNNIYGEAITNSEEFTDFLLGEDGRAKPSPTNVVEPTILQANILEKEEGTHSLLDSWEPTEGIELIQIAGWGKTTLKGLKYSASFPCTKLLVTNGCEPFLTRSPIFTKKGDKTVIYESALSSDAAKYFFNLSKENVVDSVAHANLFESETLLSFLEKVIKKEDVTSIPYFSQIEPQLSALEKTQRISIHSPVAIDLYDSNGNHTGITYSPGSDVGFFEENVPNSSYFEYSEGKYIEADPDSNSTIVLQGIGAGTFTLMIEKYTGETNTSTDTFFDIPVTPEMRGEYTVAESGIPTLSLDVDGDGSSDFMLTPTQDTDPILFFQILKKALETLQLPKNVQLQLLQKIDKAMKLITKEKENQAIANIKQFSRAIESKKWTDTKKLTPEQQQVLLVLINSLLDSIK